MVGGESHPLHVRLSSNNLRSVLTGGRVLEINTGLICSCTPTLKPFVNHFMSDKSSRDRQGCPLPEPKEVSPDRSPERGSPRNGIENEETTEKPELLSVSTTIVEEV